MIQRFLKFALEYFPQIFLGISSFVFSMAYFYVSNFDMEKLSLFGPTARIYIEGMKNGLATAMILLITSFLGYTLFRQSIEKLVMHLSNQFSSLSNTKKAFTIFLICMSFVFITHAGNIIHGYFFLDDFEVIDVYQLHSFTDSIMIPHGDHPMPIYRIETGIMYYFFNYNPTPYNIFVFVLFALIPFFTYLIFKRIGVGIYSFFIFLLLYGGSPYWSEMLTGYYVLSIYLQVILFFTIMLWSYLSWFQEKKLYYIIIFTLTTILAIMSDISSVWIFPAIFLCMFFTTPRQTGESALPYVKNILSKNKLPILIVGTIGILYAVFLAISFLWFNLIPFIYSVRVDSSLNVIRTITTFFKIISGLTMTLFMPNAAKILTHPSVIQKVLFIWPFFEILLLAVNVIIFQIIIKKTQTKDRNFIFFIIGTLILTILMVSIGRPVGGTIPDFYPNHIGMSLYFYSVLLALYVHIAMQSENKHVTRIITTLLIISMASSQAFSFHSYLIKINAEKRYDALTNLNNTFILELKNLSNSTTTPLFIPNLDGAHIYEAQAGIGLVDYLLFFNENLPITLIQNTQMFPDIKTKMVKTVPNLRASTSKEFIEALKKDGSLKNYYLSPALMTYSISTTTYDNVEKDTRMTNIGGNFILQKAVAPEQNHKIILDFTTDDISGNTKIEFSFENDFGLKGSVGRIKIDDFMPYQVEENKRRYMIETDLLQLYSFSLSEKIKDVTVTPSPEKGLIINSAFIQ